ncbi:unnamed protein product [Amoebophrya sp. A25]|nr:unnamed protein product [Amoebophrya sp. A25]|eukprot:GSA25T00013107001.1
MSSLAVDGVKCSKCKAVREVVASSTLVGRLVFQNWSRFECRHVGLACGSIQQCGYAQLVPRHKRAAVAAAGELAVEQYLSQAASDIAAEGTAPRAAQGSVLPSRGPASKRKVIFGKTSAAAAARYAADIRDGKSVLTTSKRAAADEGAISAKRSKSIAASSPPSSIGQAAPSSIGTIGQASSSSSRPIGQASSSSSRPIGQAPSSSCRTIGAAASSTCGTIRQAVALSLGNGPSSAIGTKSGKSATSPRPSSSSAWSEDDGTDSKKPAASASGGKRVAASSSSGNPGKSQSGVMAASSMFLSRGSGGPGKPADHTKRAASASEGQPGGKRGRPKKHIPGSDDDFSDLSSTTGDGDGGPDDEDDDSHGSGDEEEQQSVWVVQRISGMRIRQRPNEEAERRTLQGVVNRRKERISGSAAFCALRREGALSAAMMKHQPRSNVARAFISRLMASWEVFNPVSGVRRLLTALPRSKGKHIGSVQNRMRRFENVLRTWSAWWALKRRLRTVLQLPDGASLRNHVDMSNCDEVPCLRRYAEVGGYSLNFSNINDDNFAYARESGVLHGSILMWVHSDPALRIPPTVVLSRDWVIGSSKKKRRRFRRCVDAVKGFGEARVSSDNKRSGYFDRDLFWADMHRLGRKKVAARGIKRPLVVLLDSANFHSYTPAEAQDFEDQYGIFLLKILGGITPLVQPVDVCNIASNVRNCGQMLAEEDKWATTFETASYWTSLREREEERWHQLQHFEKCGFSLDGDVCEEVGSELFMFLARTRELHPQKVAALDAQYHRQAVRGAAPVSG